VKTKRDDSSCARTISSWVNGPGPTGEPETSLPGQLSSVLHILIRELPCKGELKGLQDKHICGIPNPSCRNGERK